MLEAAHPDLASCAEAAPLPGIAIGRECPIDSASFNRSNKIKMRIWAKAGTYGAPLAGCWELEDGAVAIP
jgi:hypothetical protein